MPQAKTLGVNSASFTTCLDNPVIAKAVEEDIAYGGQLGVSGTPKFFVGKIADGKMVDVSVISGAADYSRFENEISKRL